MKMNEENSLKKIKLDEKNNQDEVATIHSELKCLSSFKVKNILSENNERKTITLEGTFEGYEGAAIILLEQKSYNREKIQEFFNGDATVEQDFCNNIYGSYEGDAPSGFRKYKATIIHPATDKHLEKYATQKFFVVDETAELYKTVCSPHLQQEKFNLEWVFNILEHKAETERVVFEDPDPETGFILLPDLKWDGKTRECLYLLCIMRKKDITSIRDLTAEHLPLLHNILEKGTQAIKEKYGLDRSQLRIYFHYRPTFYHLHVHFTALSYDAPGCRVEKAHMLTSVIKNIELLPDYYQRVSLPLVVRQTESLYTKFVEHGVLQELTSEEKVDIPDPTRSS